MTLWENARYLASVGHEVTFVTAGYAGAAKHEVVDGLKVVRLGGIHSLWLRTFLYYMSRRGKFDVVVAEGFGGSRIPRMAPLYVKEPMITEWHQIHRDLFAVQYPKALNGPLNLLELVTARVHRNTLVRAGTKEWQEAFPTLGFKPENVFLVPVTIRDEMLRATNGSRTVGPTILWLGKLRRYKCPDHVVRAMPEVLRVSKGARLVIAGRRDDEAYERELRALAVNLGVERSVEFRFDVSEDAKWQLLHDSKILVVPSAVEGFGIVVLEANACGVPVVASTGVPEGAVRDGFNGLRYQFADVNALATKLVELLDNSDLYASLSANAVENAQRFKWSSVGPEFEGVVRKAAASRHVSR